MEWSDVGPVPAERQLAIQRAPLRVLTAEAADDVVVAIREDVLPMLGSKKDAAAVVGGAISIARVLIQEVADFGEVPREEVVHTLFAEAMRTAGD